MFNSGLLTKREYSISVIQYLMIVIALAVMLCSHAASAQKPGRNPQGIDPVFTAGDKKGPIGRAADEMYVRSETHLGCRIENYSYESEKTDTCIDDGIDPGFKVMVPQFIKLPAGSKGFVDIPRAAAKFLVDEDDTTVAITFSAMSYVSSTEDDPLLIRVLVDGAEAEPGQITLTGGNDVVLVSTSQSFTFLANVDEGIHTVQVQYSTELIPGHSSYIRNASLKINTGFNTREGDGLSGKGERTGLKIGGKIWTEIPNAEHEFYMPEEGEAAITFSSVIKMKQGDFILLRAIVDNGAFELFPKDANMAGRMYHTEARSIAFNAEELPPGAHTVKFEWRGSLTDVPAVAEMYAWSIVVRTAVNDSNEKFFDVVSQNINESTGEGPYKQVANLSTKVDVDEVSDIAVTFSGELAGFGLIFIAPTINGNPVDEQEVILYYPTIMCPDPACENPMATDSGVGSYTFALKNIPPSDDGYEIGVAYRVRQAGVSIEGSGFISGANLVVEKKLRVGPDLAVGPNMGRASKKRESIIEPVYGTRNLLAVVIDPQILEGEANSKFREEIDDGLNGGYQSVKDYYMVVSGGRLIIEKAAALGIFEAEHAGEITNDKNYYQDGENFDCDNGAEFQSGADALHAEALTQANAEFNFSDYDFNNDGEITPNELGILVVIPRDTVGGSGVKAKFNPKCSDDPFEVDGVKITETVHLNQIYEEGGLSELTRLENMMVAAHELGHHFLGLDDIYGRYKGVHDGTDFNPLLPFEDDCPEDLGPGETCQVRYMNTAPHMISLMTYKTGYYTTTTHLDGFHKLHLGWVRPSIPEKKDNYELRDVKETEDVYILPRRHDDAREYVLLETRYEESQKDAPLYEYNINDYGLAVYHIIEPGPSCQSSFGATAPGCKPLIPPVCVDEGIWFFKHGSNYARLGLRLVQPDVSHVYDKDNNDSDNDYAEFKELLFGTGPGTDLHDDGVLACTNNIGDPLPVGSEPLLLWVDGKPSGYNLLAITINYASRSVSFDLIIN